MQMQMEEECTLEQRKFILDKLLIWFCDSEVGSTIKDAQLKTGLMLDTDPALPLDYLVSLKAFRKAKVSPEQILFTLGSTPNLPFALTPDHSGIMRSRPFSSKSLKSSDLLFTKIYCLQALGFPALANEIQVSAYFSSFKALRVEQAYRLDDGVQVFSVFFENRPDLINALTSPHSFEGARITVQPNISYGAPLPLETSLEMTTDGKYPSNRVICLKTPWQVSQQDIKSAFSLLAKVVSIDSSNPFFTFVRLKAPIASSLVQQIRRNGGLRVENTAGLTTIIDRLVPLSGDSEGDYWDLLRSKEPSSSDPRSLASVPSSSSASLVKAKGAGARKKALRVKAVAVVKRDRKNGGKLRKKRKKAANKRVDASSVDEVMNALNSIL